MRAFFTLLVLTVLNMSLSAAKVPQPPVAPKKPKEIVMHGDTRVDDYFWLREKTNQEVLAYLKAENKYTDAILGGEKKRQAKIYQEMLSHLKDTDESAPVHRDD